MKKLILILLAVALLTFSVSVYAEAVAPAASSKPVKSSGSGDASGTVTPDDGGSDDSGDTNTANTNVVVPQEKAVELTVTVLDGAEEAAVKQAVIEALGIAEENIETVVSVSMTSDPKPGDKFEIKTKDTLEPGKPYTGAISFINANGERVTLKLAGPIYYVDGKIQFTLDAATAAALKGVKNFEVAVTK